MKNGERLKLKLDNLCVIKNSNEILIPLSDISMIILEGDHTSITTKILAAISKYHIGLLICDDRYLPCGQYLGFGQYHRGAKRAMQQSNWTIIQKQNIWTKIVSQKIYNQICVLKRLELEVYRIKMMEGMLEDLLLGDDSNREGHAAKVYFNTLFGFGFSREDEVYPNYCLNYGYSIIRAQTARCVSALGLLPMLGVFHRNEYNSYNLVDDLMEPFRPIVDYYVYMNLLDDKEEFLTYEKRLSLINILNHKIVVNNKKEFIDNAIYNFVNSFIKSMESNNHNFLDLISVNNYLGDE